MAPSALPTRGTPEAIPPSGMGGLGEWQMARDPVIVLHKKLLMQGSKKCTN
jgi:hypothetical protein